MSKSRSNNKEKGKSKGKGGSKSTSKSNPGKHGFPVLAYITSHPLTLSCTLRIQHHEPRKQVTLMLRTCVSLHGADDSNEEQAFVLQYDADNLLYNTSNDAATAFHPSDRLDTIVRNGNGDHTHIKTLALHLKRPTPLWCPDMDTLLPKSEPRHVELFNELVQLAKATTVRLVFDHSWLSLEQKVPIERIVKGKETLAGFPVADYYSRFYRRADWTVFAPAAEPSNKRIRRVSSPPSTPPPYKRQAIDPLYAGSPTEVATSPSLPCPKLTAHETDCQPHAITAAVQRLLPSTLKQILPEVLPSVLPSLLPTLFALPQSFTSDAYTSDLASTSTPSPKKISHIIPDTPPNYSRTLTSALTQPHLNLTPLAQSLLPHLLAHMIPQLSKMHNSSIKKWTDNAALDFAEDAEQARLELQHLVDEGIGEVVKQSGYVLEELRGQVVDVGREAAEAVGEDVEREVERRGLEAVRKIRWEVDAMKKEVDMNGVALRGSRRWGRGKGGCYSVGSRKIG
ncbi:hypothetical protein E8E13_001561 [Curvularia kusanoi]|uniref:Uncharacterized protein n=1 Tax=Curvularia kusanoi TaxID=90978 RepID=A0A9P4T5T2_CURKU|nr:hypothetical protein E8E13_001561 [Curvularia kusanoi]